MEWKNCWIKIAGNARRIRDESNPNKSELMKPGLFWRCMIVGVNVPEFWILLTYFSLVGNATPNNNVPHADPNGGSLVAWIEYFGDVIIEDARATVTLKDPPT